MKDFSVIIPTLNEDRYIGQLLEDLNKQTVYPKKIIVVDGCSSDKTALVVKKFKKIKFYLHSPQVAKQRNFGASKAKTSILIFLDADTRLKSDFFEKSLAEIEKKNLDLACPYYIPITSHPVIMSIYLLINCIFFFVQKLQSWGAGTCIIIKRETFEKLNGFDPEYKFEDIEFIRRVAKRNRYSMLNSTVYVSDRRFKKYGVANTAGKYFLISLFFIFNQFKIANTVEYKFGNYHEIR